MPESQDPSSRESTEVKVDTAKEFATWFFCGQRIPHLSFLFWPVSKACTFQKMDFLVEKSKRHMVLVL